MTLSSQVLCSLPTIIYSPSDWAKSSLYRQQAYNRHPLVFDFILCFLSEYSDPKIRSVWLKLQSSIDKGKSWEKELASSLLEWGLASYPVGRKKKRGLSEALSKLPFTPNPESFLSKVDFTLSAELLPMKEWHGEVIRMFSLGLKRLANIQKNPDMLEESSCYLFSLQMKKWSDFFNLLSYLLSLASLASNRLPENEGELESFHRWVTAFGLSYYTPLHWRHRLVSMKSFQVHQSELMKGIALRWDASWWKHSFKFYSRLLKLFGKNFNLSRNECEDLFCSSHRFLKMESFQRQGDNLILNSIVGSTWYADHHWDNSVAMNHLDLPLVFGGIRFEEITTSAGFEKAGKDLVNCMAEGGRYSYAAGMSRLFLLYELDGTTPVAVTNIVQFPLVAPGEFLNQESKLASTIKADLKSCFRGCAVVGYAWDEVLGVKNAQPKPEWKKACNLLVRHTNQSPEGRFNRNWTAFSDRYMEIVIIATFERRFSGEFRDLLIEQVQHQLR